MYTKDGENLSKKPAARANENIAEKLQHVCMCSMQNTEAEVVRQPIFMICAYIFGRLFPRCPHFLAARSDLLSLTDWISFDCKH